MKKSVLLAFLLFLFFMQPVPLWGADVAVPDVRIAGDDIVASLRVALDEKYLEEIRNGIAKEITFRVDLFRVWKNWPDEFITGKNIVRVLECDPIKKEYVGTTFDGLVFTEKRFKNCETLLSWAAQVKDLKLITAGELQTSTYLVKVSAESRLKKPPSVVGYLFFFVPDNEFSLSRNSLPFTAGGR